MKFTTILCTLDCVVFLSSAMSQTSIMPTRRSLFMRSSSNLFLCGEAAIDRFNPTVSFDKAGPPGLPLVG